MRIETDRNLISGRKGIAGYPVAAYQRGTLAQKRRLGGSAGPGEIRLHVCRSIDSTDGEES